MKRYNVRYSELYYEDITNITTHIVEKTGSIELALNFARRAKTLIDKRSKYAASFQSFKPYEGSSDFYRIYIGKYIIFYTLVGDDMIIHRILWGGADLPKKFK